MRLRMRPARSAYFCSAHWGFPVWRAHLDSHSAQPSARAAECICGAGNKDFYDLCRFGPGAREKSCVLSVPRLRRTGRKCAASADFRASESRWLGQSIRCERARFKRSKVENTAPGCSRGGLTLKTEPFENRLYKQRLTMKARSRLRVICATPIQKRAAPRTSTRFLCCVCISHR
jgi:hypothetical protein